jgi:transcriptional regulator with XRE-family HTH domain
MKLALRHPLAQLRLVLFKMGQKEMAQLVGVSPYLIQSIELRRATLTPEVASRIAEASGCDLGWLLDGDVTKPIINYKGEPYTPADFIGAYGRASRFYKTTGYMALCVAYVILARVLDVALQSGNDRRSDRFGFVYRLDRFVRAELDRYPRLRDGIFSELKRVQNSDGAPLGSILVPTSAESLEKAGFAWAAQAFEERQTRLGKKKLLEKSKQKVIKK